MYITHIMLHFLITILRFILTFFHGSTSPPSLSKRAGGSEDLVVFAHAWEVSRFRRRGEFSCHTAYFIP